MVIIMFWGTGPSLGKNESSNFPGSIFEIFRFSILEICLLEIFSKIMLVRYRGKIIKVSWRDPGQNGRFWGPFLVLWNVSLPENVEKWTFRCHVRPNGWKFACMTVCSVRSPWKPPNLPNFNLNCQKNSFYEKPDFSNSFFARDGPVVWCQCGVSLAEVFASHCLQSLNITIKVL